jgi:BirA family transcriptional regulator, biotin operon repressor / biotin---[acetyl-CoA-carboxylase] ligase
MDVERAAACAGFTVELHDCVGSTNDVAMDHLRAGGAPGHFVLALSQNGGRGRLGRSWESRRGNLFVSLALVDPAERHFLYQLSFVAAVAVLETLIASGVAKDRMTLKWPNDVLVDGKKISGILVEGTSLPSGSTGVVIGCGINIVDHPREALYPVTDLHAAGVIQSLDSVFASFAAAMANMLRLYRHGSGFAEIRARWMAAAQGLGQPIVIRDPKSERQGLFAGLDDSGRLLLDEDGCVAPVTTGDVFFQPEGID